MKKLVFFGAMVAIAVPATAKQTADIRITGSRSVMLATDSGDYVELAQAYLRAGRTGDAALAYRRAMARDNVMMVSRHGDPVWSHEIARNALALLPQLAAR